MERRSRIHINIPTILHTQGENKHLHEPPIFIPLHLLYTQGGNQHLYECLSRICLFILICLLQLKVTLRSSAYTGLPFLTPGPISTRSHCIPPPPIPLPSPPLPLPKFEGIECCVARRWGINAQIGNVPCASVLSVCLIAFEQVGEVHQARAPILIRSVLGIAAEDAE